MNVSACWFHRPGWLLSSGLVCYDAHPNCPACKRRDRIVEALHREAFNELTAEEIESIAPALQPEGGLTGSDVERAVARGINNRGSY
jgi:hypothetical protein